jgi:2-acylglycerol O-acyltransferase 2
LLAEAPGKMSESETRESRSNSQNGDDSEISPRAGYGSVGSESGYVSDVSNNNDVQSLLGRIQFLESENRRLRDERDKAKKSSIFAISTPDIYSNLTKLQINFREQFAKSYESLKQGIHVDPKPWIEEAAKLRGLDSTQLMASLGVRKKRQFMATLITFLLLPMSMTLTLFWMYFAIRIDRTYISGAILLAYMTYIYLDPAHEKGSKPTPWVKKHGFWKWLAGYFPIVVVKQNPKTVFDPQGTYMFGYHPHGIISAGCFTTFAANATGIEEIIPNIKFYPATLNNNFYVPFWRDLLLHLGAIGVSANALKYVLSKGPGNAVVVVPGGAAEALDARPGTHSLTLKKRQGFFRIALEHGASLVPIYSFGENDLYEQASNDEGTFVRKVQNVFLKYAGFATPFFSGAGGAGVAIPMNPIPARVPIITVIGDPIKCPKIESPTQADIDKVRILYVKKLQEIFKQFADRYAPQRSSDLEILK